MYSHYCVLEYIPVQIIMNNNAVWPSSPFADPALPLLPGRTDLRASPSEPRGQEHPGQAAGPEAGVGLQGGSSAVFL